MVFVGTRVRDPETENIPEYVLSICEVHFPAVTEDTLTDDRVYKTLTEGNDLAWKGGLGIFFVDAQ